MSNKKDTSVSQQIRAIRHEHEQTRDALANLKDTLRPEDHHGWMLHKLLTTSLDQAQMYEIAITELREIAKGQRRLEQHLSEHTEEENRRFAAIEKRLPHANGASMEDA